MKAAEVKFVAFVSSITMVILLLKDDHNEHQWKQSLVASSAVKPTRWSANQHLFVYYLHKCLQLLSRVEKSIHDLCLALTHALLNYICRCEFWSTEYAGCMQPEVRSLLR